ncbi:LacI family DNA-binding transcriptional regulator [Psychromonas ossibalaenae]|uniref:LacI family DNA-binding transcriptional regulator n=1 Tax=Psychromonas ossibalaenae TaxID=444922 RepID=UPI0003662E25|nr:LacI family DNA-binding transcriptional regulator [Psychromonas ossibalaenae]
MSKKVTMSDIAAAVGVSQSTVSLVLNGSTSIKITDVTRKKVLDTAESLGYRNKKVIHASSGTKKIAMVVNWVIGYDPFISAINACREEAWANDYVLVIFNYGHDKMLASKIEEEINNNEYVGLIYASSMTRILEQQRVNTHLPCVLLNCTNESNLQAPSILPADIIGAYKATKHLIEQGYRRIAILTGESWMWATEQRIKGYRQALLDADISLNDEYVLEANWSLKEAYQQTLKLLDLNTPPKAIFCSSDYMALGCYQAVIERGLHIPNDIAVVGYDNKELALEVSPDLTSVDSPYLEMGRQAVESLLTLLENQPLLSMKRKVEGELIVRRSSIKNHTDT